DIVWPLPVSDLLFVGRSARETFNRLGIETIGDLAKSSRDMISAHLGKSGELVHDYANGIDASPVQSAFSETSPKSIGRGLTYSHDLTDISEVKTALLALSDDVAQRLRRHKMCALGVSLTVRDPSFKTTSRQKTLTSPTHLASDISKACLELYEKYYLKAHAPVRMLTVTAISLISEDLACASQISLFGEDVTSSKRESVELALDEIRKKFGRDATTPASLLNGEFGVLKKDEK
ncbi:MAG: DNA polymerase IV, partial [Oscillospiraceae bacterium]|nr:DNA polymerase IV [Oscillospiraceae bacterium]